MTRERIQQAAVALQRGDLATAERRLAEVLVDDRQHFDARHLLALTRSAAGKSDDAVALLRVLATERPGDAAVLENLALAQSCAGLVDECLTTLRSLTALAPTNAVGWRRLGDVLVDVGHLEKGEAALRTALELDAGAADVYESLGHLFESQGRLDELSALLKEAPRSMGLDLLRGQLAARQGDTPTAIALLNAIVDSDSASPSHRSMAAARLGRALERCARYSDAFDAFTFGNAQARQLVNDNVQSVYGLESIDAMRRLLQRATKSAAVVPENDLAPIFLVGFPRSGTTLMDRMLNAHPSLQVLEETNPLAAVLDLLVAEGRDLDLADQTDVELEELRAVYFSALANQSEGEQRAVDKLPLNSLFLPLIHRLFPAAKIIFALRDPRDVVVSCWAQAFDPNPAMAHFIELESAAKFYAATMTLALDCLDALPLQAITVSYESLISEPKKTIENLLDFLDLPWDDAVLSYRHSLRGQAINTPSYDQVDRPLYTSSVGRWKHYESQLGNRLNLLQPLVARLGHH